MRPRTHKLPPVSRETRAAPGSPHTPGTRTGTPPTSLWAASDPDLRAPPSGVSGDGPLRGMHHGPRTFTHVL
jgi:hypothetical protein